MFRIKLLMTVSVMAGAVASGQVPWSANASTAVPLFPAIGSILTETVDVNPHGRGVRPHMGLHPTPLFLYIPITAPNNNSSGCLGLRAEDTNAQGGFVVAELYRQPRSTDPSGFTLLGSVATSTSGFQYREKQISFVTDYAKFTYYIRLKLTPAAPTATQPIAFDVSLIPHCG